MCVFFVGYLDSLFVTGYRFLLSHFWEGSFRLANCDVQLLLHCVSCCTGADRAKQIETKLTGNKQEGGPSFLSHATQFLDVS